MARHPGTTRRARSCCRLITISRVEPDNPLLAIATVFSLLTLLHAFHSHLLHSHLLSLPPALRPALPPPTAHDRYTRSWARHSVLYRLASGALIGVGGVQLLGEMIALKGWASAGPAASTPEARAKGQRHWERRWKWLVGVEGTKYVPSNEKMSRLALTAVSLARRAVLRLILLLLTSRPLLSPPLPSPSLDPALFAAAPAGSTKAEPSAADTGRPKDPIREILLPKTLFAGSLTPGRELVRALSPRGMLGEALHSVRGLIYVLMLRTRSSSLPVILSLLVALVSRALLRGQQATGYRKGKEREGAQVPLGSLERDEFARRDRALGGLLFRGVVWDGLTKCVRFLPSLIAQRPDSPHTRAQADTRGRRKQDTADPARRPRRRSPERLRPAHRLILLLHRLLSRR